MVKKDEQICFGFCGNLDDSEFVSKTYLQINNCGVLRWEDYAPSEISSRIRKDHMIVYVSEGNGTMQIGDKTESICAGDLIYYPPDTSLSFSFGPYSQHYWIHFTGTAVDSIIESANLRYNTIHKIGLRNDLCLLFSKIAFSIRQDCAIESLSINSNFLKVLYIVSTELNSKNSTANLSKDHPAVIAKNFMMMEFWKNHDADYYAKNCGCSVSTLNHSFQKYFQTSPKKFLTMLRVEHAKKLLVETNLSIKSISNSSGYDDPLYFSKVFKNSCNMTPKEYRSKYQ